MVAAAVVGGALVSTVGGSLLSDDGGAGAANAAAADSTRMQAEIAKDQWNRYKQIYAPLEDAMVSAAQQYDTPAQYERAAGEASGAVAQAFGNARGRLARTPGLDPTSAAYTASLADLDRTQAAADAVAQNTARKTVADTAWARKSDMLSLGKGLPAQSASMLGSAASASASQANAAYARSANEAAAFGGAVRDVAGGLGTLWNGSNTPGLGSGQAFSGVANTGTFSAPSTAFGTAPTSGSFSAGTATVGTPNYGFGL